ncbi:MAG: DUF503 domain-containing protein [candidate division Zixibacteria bacterium]|nr:DUF503 domain-containing protein [candidate division Zixibacteria bacterium]
MHLASLRIVLHIPQSRSLKDKRHVIRAIKDRLKNKFNISVAEIDDNDLWQRATLGVAVVANDGPFIDSVLSSIESFIAANPEVVIVDVERNDY